VPAPDQRMTVRMTIMLMSVARMALALIFTAVGAASSALLVSRKKLNITRLQV
jgi:hypothetical protein